ncbi:hypothetical protein BC826DRAFT_1025048, partial [Russula brevipes]
MRPPNKRSSGGFELLARVSALLGALSRYLPGHLNHPSPLDPFPQPVHPSSRRQIVPSLRKSTEKKTSLLADTQETAEGTSTTVFQPRGRGLSVYPPSGHGRAMDDPNTPMIAVSAPLGYTMWRQSREDINSNSANQRHRSKVKVIAGNLEIYRVCIIPQAPLSPT